MATIVSGVTYKVARTTPPAAVAVGIPVPSSGAVPRGAGCTREMLAALGFTGEVATTLVLPPESDGGHVRILVGIGDPKKPTPNVLRNCAAALARAASGHESLATSLPAVGKGGKSAAAQAVVEGMAMALHRYGALKSDHKAPKLALVTLVVPEAAADQAKSGIAAAVETATAVCRARDFANTPPSHLTASQFAEQAVEIARTSGLRATVYGPEQLADMGCGGILGVNAGSEEPPRVVKLTWTPKDAKGKVVLVGKGVMYDSGGISLKPSDAMHAAMKMDMSGAAAVLATMGALKGLKCKTAVTAYLMCTDNMPSGSAMKLGDVLHMRNGKTVEIHNTDAEGRLLLADGLALGAETKPDAMVDIATLTGACVVALGEDVAGLYGTHGALVEQAKASSERTDEPVWEMPLQGSYRKMLDSAVADMRNIGGPYGGSITAALFLREFVGDVPWLHLDIAGPMKVDSDVGWRNRGATAFGTRLLIDFVCNFRKLPKR
jgi:leucyl aminopeptidase